jgi:hypothetical protein
VFLTIAERTKKEVRLLRNVFVVLPILALCVATSAFASVVFDLPLIASSGNLAPPGSVLYNGSPAIWGGVGGPFGFGPTSDGILTMTVTDLDGAVGAVYQVFVDNISLGFTSGVVLGGPTVSSGVFTVALTPGTHTFDINDQIISYVGQEDPYGGGIVPGGFSIGNVHVVGDFAAPEPGSMFLLGAGLLGLAGFARKLRKA